MADRPGKVKIFISWSGVLSRSVAHSLKKFLPRVIQTLDPWVSDVDITKGTLWNGAIMKSLQEARFGIIVLTNENVSKPWLHYETGYMSHYIQDDQRGLVSPLLVEVPTSALEGPMQSLQATNFDEADVLKLIEDINRMLDDPLTQDNLSYAFSNAWAGLQDEVDAAIKTHSNPEDVPEPFNQEKVLTQILDTVRDLSRRQDPSLNIEKWLRTRSVNPGDTVLLDTNVLLNRTLRDQLVHRLAHSLPDEMSTSVDGRVVAVKDSQDGGDQPGDNPATE